MSLDLKFQEEGDKLFREGKFFDAEQSYYKINEEFLRHFSLGLMQFSLGEDHLAKGDFLVAKGAAEKNLEYNFLKAIYALGKTEYELGYYKEAKKNLEEVLLLNPDGDVEEDIQRMLKRMKFGFLSKFGGNVKNFVLKNPFYSCAGIFLGSILTQMIMNENEIIWNNHELSYSLVMLIANYSLLNALSKKFTRRRIKGVEFDSLIKYDIKKEGTVLKDTCKNLKENALKTFRPFTVYSVGDLLFSHHTGLLLGTFDFIGSFTYAKFKDKFNFESISNYSIPIALASLLPFSYLAASMNDPNFPVWQLGYLTHLSVKSLGEKDLFKKDKGNLEYFLNRVNKISLIGGLVVAGLVEKLEINQFESILENVGLSESIHSIIHSHEPANFINLLAVSSFFIKHSILSFVNQEFKSKNNLGILKSLSHYPLIAGALGGIYGYLQEPVSYNVSLNQNLLSTAYYSGIAFLGANILGGLTRFSSNLPNYIDYLSNKFKGNLEEAIKAYRKIVDRSYSLKTKKMKHIKLGGLLLKSINSEELKEKRYEEAFLEFDKASKIEIKSLSAFDLSLNVISTVNLETKGDLDSIRSLALLNSGLGKIKEARKQWEKILSLENNLMNNCLYAEFLTKNNFEDANGQWRKVISLISDQKPEIESLDSTHIVQHIKGKYLDYVLKYGDKENLEKELDLTNKLAEKVRNHPEFLAPDPLTVFENNGESVLATRYLNKTEMDLSNMNQLKKVIEYMHLIYSLGIRVEKMDERKITLDRAYEYVNLTGDEKFLDLVYAVLGFQSGSDLILLNTDSSPSNYGIIVDSLFRCDLEFKGGCHPYLDLSRLLCLTNISQKEKEGLVEYYANGFGKSQRRMLKNEGLKSFYAKLGLRAVQIIPRHSIVENTDSMELPFVFDSLEQSLSFFEKENRSNLQAEFDYLFRLRSITLN